MIHCRAKRMALGAATTFFLVAAPFGCGGSSLPPAASPADPGASPERLATGGGPTGERLTGGSPLSFRFPDASGQGELTAQSLRGRTTIIALVTTYDLASQAQVRILTSVHRKHQPRLNVAAIALEPAANMPLVAAFHDSLGLDYPMAIAEPTDFTSAHPFGDVRTVPSVLILDPDGRLVWRHLGLAQPGEIEAALAGP